MIKSIKASYACQFIVFTMSYIRGGNHASFGSFIRYIFASIPPIFLTFILFTVFISYPFKDKPTWRRLIKLYLLNSSTELVEPTDCNDDDDDDLFASQATFINTLPGSSMSKHPFFCPQSLRCFGLYLYHKNRSAWCKLNWGNKRFQIRFVTHASLNSVNAGWSILCCCDLFSKE